MPSPYGGAACSIVQNADVTEEMIDVLDSAGAPTGVVKPKSAVHREGDWHRAVHLWLLTPDDRLLLQLRSKTKPTYPGLWDVSCAGHVSAGESAERSAVRELEEELGLHASETDFEYIGEVIDRLSFLDGTHHENEFQTTLLLRRDVSLGAMQLQESEVEAVKLVTVEDFAAATAARDASLAPHWRGYELLMKYLGRQLFA